MAITRTVHRIDIQWDQGDPVLTIIGEITDDVEQTAAGRHLATKRSDLGPTAQAKLDAFLADVLTFAGSQVPGPIGYPS